MADSLILKGIKDVRKHKGDEMLFRYPKGRGDAQHQLKRWWINGGVTKLYTPASVFDVTTPVELLSLPLQLHLVLSFVLIMMATVTSAFLVH